MLVKIRSNGPFDVDDPVSIKECIDEDTKILKYDGYKYFTEEIDAINFLYGMGFENTNLCNRAILCSLNENVDIWNTKIQLLNNNPVHELKSTDILADIDDPHHHLQSMLNINTLAFYEKPGIPKHKINIKVGDICFLVQTVSKEKQLNRNTRVKIVGITRYKIDIETLMDCPIRYCMCRHRFTIKHTLGFSIIRTQFPIQLAYAMTKNKAQGQGLEFSINDIRESSFTHGQEYVALSRPFRFDGVAIFCNEDQIDNGKVLIQNIVYQELIT
jgi:ATP-dependent DNA helicase PIF1